MVKRVVFLVIFLIFGFLIMVGGDVLAQEKEMAVSPSVEEVDSFELFWPMVAGKTRESGIYRIKKLKEEVRGWLIFGKPQKASYKVFLGVKRVLEAEKLIKEGKTDLALETLRDAQIDLRSSMNLIETARKVEPGASIDPQAYSRLVNLEKLIDWLNEQENSENVALLLSEVKTRIQDLLMATTR